MEPTTHENLKTGAGSEDGNLVFKMSMADDGGFTAAVQRKQTKVPTDEFDADVANLGMKKQKTKKPKLDPDTKAQKLAKRQTIKELLKKNEESVVKTRKYQDIELELNEKKLKAQQTFKRRPTHSKSSKPNLDSVNSEDLNESLFSIEDEQENDVDLIFDTRISNSLFSQLVVAEYCSLFFAMSGLILAVIAREERLTYGEEDLEIHHRVVLWSMVCTICLLISIVIRYDLWLRWSITA